MNLFRLSVLCGALAFASATQAEIYKRVDKDGHVTYSSAPIKGAQKMQLEPLPTMAGRPVAPKANSNSPSEFRINSSTQNRRDDARRKILEDELATEEKSLTEARTKLQEAEDTPEVYKTASGQTLRNMAKYEEKVNAAREAVKAHENNVSALKTELSNLK